MLAVVSSILRICRNSQPLPRVDLAPLCGHEDQQHHPAVAVDLEGGLAGRARARARGRGCGCHGDSLATIGRLASSAAAAMRLDQWHGRRSPRLLGLRRRQPGRLHRPPRRRSGLAVAVRDARRLEQPRFLASNLSEYGSSTRRRPTAISPLAKRQLNGRVIDGRRHRFGRNAGRATPDARSGRSSDCRNP